MTVRRHEREKSAQNPGASGLRRATIHRDPWLPAERRRRLELLYDIGKQLTMSVDIDSVVPSVLSIATEALELTSAVLALRDEGSTRLLAWPVDGADIGAASEHARIAFAYLLHDPGLSSRGMEIRRGALRLRGAQGAAAGGAGASYLVLPLAVGRRGIFGALQLESARALDELDLSFADSFITQLAVALDRHLTHEHRAADSERSLRHAKALAHHAQMRETIAEARERRSREERDFARAVTRSLGECVLAVGLDGRVTLINEAAERFLGCPEATAIGRPVDEVVRVLTSDGHLVARGEIPMARVMRTTLEERGDDLFFAGAGGDPHPVAHVCTPLWTGDRVTGAVLGFEDISSLRLAEREQRILADLGVALGSFLDTDSIVAAVCRLIVPRLADVAFVDVAGKGGACDRSEVVLSEAVAASLAPRLRAHAPRPGWDTPQARVIMNGKPVLVGDAEGVAASAHDAEEREALRAARVSSLATVPLVVRDRVLGALTCGLAGAARTYRLVDLAFIEEIAMRAAFAMDNARLYEGSQAAIRARDDVIGVVAHDLRNPLGAIIMAASALMRTPEEDDRRQRGRKMLETIKRSAMRMNTLVDRLLDMSRIEAGKLTLDVEDCEVEAFVAEAVATIEPLAKAKGVKVRTDVAAGGACLRGDIDRLFQVLGNLLGNALKFTERGGSIVLGARAVGAELVLAVADTGSGIAPALLPHVFDPYWQARPGTRTGAGLGLAIAKGIVEAHGGRIWVDSEVGVGTTFSVALPRPPVAPDDERSP